MSHAGDVQQADMFTMQNLEGPVEAKRAAILEVAQGLLPDAEASRSEGRTAR